MPPSKPYTLTVAELLLLLADRVSKPRDQVVDATEMLGGDGMDNVYLTRITTALRFKSSRPSVRLRAIVEDWSLQDIIREVY